MTQPTTESRLDRLEAMAETVLLTMQQQQEQTRVLQTGIEQQQQQTQVLQSRVEQQTQANQTEIQSTQAEMRQSIEDVVRMIVTLAESADEDRKLMIGMQTSIVGMQNSITGMQTENRRILDHLLNNRSDS